MLKLKARFHHFLVIFLPFLMNFHFPGFAPSLESSKNGKKLAKRPLPKFKTRFLKSLSITKCISYYVTKGQLEFILCFEKKNRLCNSNYLPIFILQFLFEFGLRRSALDPPKMARGGSRSPETPTSRVLVSKNTPVSGQVWTQPRPIGQCL